MQRTVLISGGSGFLGSHLSDRFLRDSWEVHITSRTEGAETGRSAQLHACDLSDIDAAREIVDRIRPQIIIHLAGAVSAQPELPLVLPMFHSHATSAVNLMTLASEGSVGRLVLCGSMTEGLGDVPASPYGAAKTVVSLYTQMFRLLFDAPLVLVRPFMTFGPRQNPSKVLPYVIRSLESGVPPKLASCRYRADWIYVSDVIEGFFLAATTEGIEGASFELGRGELCSVRDMILSICSRMNSDIEPEFGALADRPHEPERVADTDTARSLLGWCPEVSLEDGLRKTIASYTGGEVAAD